MMKRVLMFGILAILGAGRTAEAVNDTLGTATQAVLGERRAQALGAGGVAYFGYQLAPDRSYAAFCWESTLEIGGALSGFCSVEIRNFSDVSIGTAISSEPFPKGGSAATVTVSGLSFNLGFVRVTSGSAQTVNVILIETTLASPWYFVSSSTAYDAYIEIRNNTTSTLSVTVRAYANTGGAVAGSTTVSLPANGNTFVTATSLGIINGFGSVTITHNGMPGAVVANATTLSATTGLSFDAPFSPRVVWSTF